MQPKIQSEGVLRREAGYHLVPFLVFSLTLKGPFTQNTCMCLKAQEAAKSRSMPCFQNAMP